MQKNPGSGIGRLFCQMFVVIFIARAQRMEFASERVVAATLFNIQISEARKLVTDARRTL